MLYIIVYKTMRLNHCISHQPNMRNQIIYYLNVLSIWKLCNID